MELGIGKRIRQLRLELQLSQKELAHKMGYKSEAAICKVENGEDNITLDRVSKFAKALGCTPSYLMGWEDEEKAIDNKNEIVKEIEKRGLSEEQIKSVMHFVDLFLKLPPDKQKAIENLLE